jgi:hypothetical protein
MTVAQPEAATGIARAQKPALLIGLLGLAASGVGWVLNDQAFYRAWLPSYIFWFDIVAGCLAILMLQYVTGGEWGLMIRRPLGAAARTMIIMPVFFVPVAMSVVLGHGDVYPWADPAVMGHDAHLQLKQAYLNPTAWIIRAAIYFAIWIGWAWRLRHLSLEFAKTRSPYTELSRRKWSAAGLLMIVLTLTFASIDWVMSLEPKWTSTMFGISFTIGAGLAAFAFVTFLLTQLAGTKALSEVVKPSHFRDLGNLMLAFVMLWAYTAFSQFLLIWYANLKEEIPYYLKRQHGTWGFIAAALVLFHFFLPFFMLLMRPIKDRPKTIAIVTVIIMVMRYVDIYWLVAPAYYGFEFQYPWMGLASLVGIGGIWLWVFIQQLKGQTIIPIHETWVEEALREGAVKVHA